MPPFIFLDLVTAFSSNSSQYRTFLFRVRCIAWWVRCITWWYLFHYSQRIYWKKLLYTHLQAFVGQQPNKHFSCSQQLLISKRSFAWAHSSAPPVSILLLLFLLQLRIKCYFYFSKQMKLKIQMENVILTHIKPIFLLTFILQCVLSHHNNSRMIVWRVWHMLLCLCKTGSTINPDSNSGWKWVDQDNFELQINLPN